MKIEKKNWLKQPPRSLLCLVSLVFLFEGLKRDDGNEVQTFFRTKHVRKLFGMFYCCFEHVFQNHWVGSYHFLLVGSVFCCLPHLVSSAACFR